MYYALFYKTVDDYITAREKYREEHLAHANASFERGDMVMAGAYDDPPDGALLLFKGESKAVAEDFAKGDPYVKNGIVVRWWVRPWTVVIGG